MIGTYAWAREQHACGATVSCGLFTHPGYCGWCHPLLERQAERDATNWFISDIFGRNMEAEKKIAELADLVAMTADYTPADTAEMADLCTEMHQIMDFVDSVQADEDAATAALKSQLAGVRAPYKTQLEAAARALLALKAALVRKVEADEAATLAAVSAKQTPPAPTSLPKGLRAGRKTVLASVDPAQLADEYLSVVPDVDAILSAAEAGRDVAGAVTEIVHSVVYTRGKKAK